MGGKFRVKGTIEYVFLEDTSGGVFRDEGKTSGMKTGRTKVE